ncbi:hypothetical protein [Paraburkholderia pallida]|uniref:Uncharacterized protein n=1 Tax=Paraburkholderia pallida TaxID=2547399 RepID=A0A4P7D5U5_9BURK|nr:hypothetical protein [Paraburkholderia pallida]QBR01962.1 hypothetical protein E1956_33060 [Paraburkholderia pallida]
MPGRIAWGRALLRLWAVATLFWIVGTLWVLVPHYFTAPLTPSAIEIQRAVQNQLDCLGHGDAGSAVEPRPQGTCAASASSPGQDARLDIAIQTASDGSLTLSLGDGERIEGVPRNVSAREVADQLHRQFTEDDLKTSYAPIGRDALFVLAPPFAVLFPGLAAAWVLRRFLRRKQGNESVRHYS